MTTAFPAFIRAEFDASSGGFRDFEQAFQRSTKNVEQQFTATFDKVGQTINRALTKGIGAGGKIDLDTSALRQAVADAKLTENALEALLRTSSGLAVATGDTTAATRRYIQAIEAQRIEAQIATRTAEAELATQTRLQAALDATSAANSRLAQSYRETYTEAARAAELSLANNRLTSSIAPGSQGFGPRAVDNGAGASALANLAKRQDQAAQATENYKRKVAELTQQLFPLETQTARVAEQIRTLETAYRRGDISAAQLAQGQQKLNASLTQLGGNARGARQAMVQTGQQIQDLGISLISGQRASTVFAQQLPQLAFALTSLEGSSNKTANSIGRFAGILSGPLGSVALVAASFGIGILIDRLFSADDATKKLEKTNRTLIEVLNDEKSSVEQVTEALRDYYSAKDRARQISIVEAQAAAASAAEKLKEAIAIRTTTAARLQELNVQFRQQSVNLNNASEFGNLAAASIAQEIGSVEKQISDNEKKIAELTKLARDAVSDVANELATLDTSPERAVKTRFELLRDDARAAGLSVDALRKKIADLNRQEESALKSLQSNGRQTRGTGDPALPAVTGSEIARLLGTSITSGKRTPAQNRAAGGSANSLHLTGLAIDIPLTVNGKPLTKEGIRAALEPAGVQIRELLGPGDKGHSDHFHIGFARRRLRPDQVAQRQERADEARNRAIEHLNRQLQEADQRVGNINGQFDRIPNEIDRARNAQIELNQIIERTQKLIAEGIADPEQKSLADKIVADAERAKKITIPQFERERFDGQIRALEERVELNRAIASGDEERVALLELQFDIMGRIGVRSEAAFQDELDRNEALRNSYKTLQDITAELVEQDRQQARLERTGKTPAAQLRELDGLRGSLEQSIAQLPNDARGAITGFLDSVRAQFNDYFARQITDSLFGDAFQEIEDQITGRSKVREANETLAESSITAADAIRELAQAAASAARGAVNDNARSGIAAGFGRFRGSAAAAGASGLAEDILVTANTGSPDAFIRAFTKVGEVFWGKGSPIAKDIGTLGKTALQGSFIGQTAGGLLLGRGGSSTGSAIGGALGQVAGEAIGKSLGALGSAAGPLGAIAGGLLGGVLGGALKKTKTGTATIGAGADGSLSIASFGGNSKSFQRTAGQGGDSVIATVERIAEALGAGVNAAGGSVSIGLRDGKFRVDTSGQGITKTKRGAIDFGEDSEAAIRFATADLIKDGVLTGLKATTQRILQSGKDLDAALQKALDFEGVFTRLKEYKDPVGAALDALDREFTRLQKIFKDAGASTEEYAQLEELYGIERNKAVKEAAERLTSSLKGLLDELTIGDSGRSLRDRLAAAQAEFDPLRARVLAGDTSAYDDFAEAARSLLEIQRQFSGSQTPYFTLLDDITAITKARIDAEANVAAISSGRDSPFNSNGQATGAANDNAAVVGAIETQTQQLLNGFAQIMAGYSNGGIREAGFRFAEFV